ncbi:unnamed protein product [Phytophthora lilii]|uniref:Unnamed protein product n=1 Tax=Phytophthora lilii TaxID=2077276 RepID=A0A9W6TQZ5_9STRA|nr:unnamed protein product [Phytophthora lilii]
MEVFRPKNFRHLHSVITTSWEPVEGMINLSGMMVNSPEPYAMKAVTKTLSDKTPLAVTLKLTATDKVLLTGEESGLSLGPLAAISQSSQIVLPSTEFSEEAVQKAMKVEHCSVVGSGFENFKRV